MIEVDYGPIVAMYSPSVFLQGVHHAFAQTDGTYAWPNSLEGDLLKQAKKEIDMLLSYKKAIGELL